MQNPFQHLIPQQPAAPAPPQPYTVGQPDPIVAARENRAERADARAAAAAERAATAAERTADMAGVPSGYRRTAAGGLEPIPGGPSDPRRDQSRIRPLPEAAIGQLRTGTNTTRALETALRSFQDNYGGNLLGGLENTLQGTFNTGTPGQAQWWARFNELDNIVRNQLFGASLTAGEQAAWERTTISPRMSPAQIRQNITERLEIARNALQRDARTYRANGYNPDAISEQLGDYRTLLNDEGVQDAGRGLVQGVQAGGLGQGGENEDFGRQANLYPAGSVERLQMLERIHNARQGHADIYIGLGDSPREEEMVNQWGLTAQQMQELEQEYQSSLPIIEARRNREQWAAEHPFLAGVDTTVRNIANVATLGLADRAAGALPGGGGTEAQHAITATDWENRPGASLTGTVAGGFVLPAGRTLPRQVGLGAGYGGTYEFNAADGSVADRLDNALVGAIGGGATSWGIGAALRGGDPTAHATMQAFDRQGVNALAADVGSPMIRRMTGGVGQSTFGTNALVSAAEQQTQQFGRRVGQLADAEGGSVARNMLGERLQGTLDRYNQTSATEGRNIYAGAREAADNQLYQGRGAFQNLNSQIRELSSTPNTSSDLVSGLTRLRDDIASDQGLTNLDIDAIRRLRTNVRAQAQSEGLRATDYQRRAGEVLDSLRDDIASQLSPGAREEFLRADQLWADRLDFIDDVETRLLGPKNDRSAEQITRRLLEMSRSDSARFRRVLEQIGPEEAGIIRGTVIREMGRPPAGNPADFSIETWARNYRTIRDNSRSLGVLFRGQNRQHADDLLTIAEAIEGAGQYRNFSNTAGALNVANLIRGLAGGSGALAGGLPGALIAGGAMIGLESAVGRLLASPRFARWLARPPRNPGQAMRALRQLTVADPALRSDIGIILEALQGAQQPQQQQQQQEPFR